MESRLCAWVRSFTQISVRAVLCSSLSLAWVINGGEVSNFGGG